MCVRLILFDTKLYVACETMLLKKLGVYKPVLAAVNISVFSCTFKAEDSSCTLQQIMIFSTGANCIPPLGFIFRPSLQFTTSRFPIANTCANCLSIPLEHDVYENFKEAMEFGFLNCAGFGLP